MAEFKHFKEALNKQFSKMTKEKTQLYVTDVEGEKLWELYLDSFPTGTNNVFRVRRENDCSSCRSFVKHYGNIVSIIDGKKQSIWDIEGLEHPYNVVASKLSALVKESKISNIFVSQFAKLGTDKNVELSKDGKTITWQHFYFELPSSYVNTSGNSIERLQANIRDSKNVFERSLNELTLDSALTMLELIEQGSIYRGEEHKKAVSEFISYKKAYDNLTEDKDIWLWKNAVDNPVVRIRNTALGTILIDLSEGVELDVAVAKFEKVMAPTNYKRPTAVITKRMIEDAQKKIGELGYNDSLPRRFAVVEDITVNNVLYVNRDVVKKMNGGSVFDELKESVATTNSKKFDKVEEVGIEDFIKNILPKASNVELLVESKHQNNLMSLIAPVNKDAPSMFKWNSNFSWAYNGDITDSIMKQNVKAAGGKVDGVLRFSIQWNDDGKNNNDFDAHCIEPKGNHIYFASKNNYSTTGNLDVDIRVPGNRVAVENITWTDINQMQKGRYAFYVHNFAHRGGQTGFTAEIEYNGELYSFSYDKELNPNQTITVAEINFDKKTGITFIKSLDSTSSSKDVWGIKTNQFRKVSMCMFSPNYWDDQVGIGNKHYFFILDGCKNENTPRGFFNEFLKEELTPHRKVFEALGSKMRVEDSDEQLSGLGFSSTQRNSIVAKVDGSFSRMIKIVF